MSETRHCGAIRLPSGNSAPAVDADQSSAAVFEGQSASNTGTWSDPGLDVVLLSASIGAVVKNNDGTWAWSWLTNDGPTESQIITITAIDSDGASMTVEFLLEVSNLSPRVTSLTNSSPDCGQAREGEVVLIVVNFMDSGTADSHVVSIDWGTDRLQRAQSPAATANGRQKAHTPICMAESTPRP